MRTLPFALARAAVVLAAALGSSWSAAAPCPVISVSPATLGNATAGQVYGPVAFGALPASTYAFEATGLPTGLTMSPGGSLSGTPDQSGTFAIRTVATDSSGCVATHVVPLIVSCPTITVTNPVTTSGAAGAPFSQTFTQSGATTPVFSTASTLPSPMTLSPAGVLSGTPAQMGLFPIVVTVTDTAAGTNGCTGTSSTYNLTIAPAAASDSYPPSGAIVGNMAVDTTLSTGFSVLTNDTPGSTATLVGGGTTAQGGQVALNPATGTFTYNPPRGFEGIDSFQYFVTNSSVSSANATVTLTVTGVAWFVDNNAGACASACDGRRSNPYTSLALFQAANDGTALNPKANHRIFLYESSPAQPYTGPVTLLTGQRLIGQDSAGSFAAATGLSVPADTVGVPPMNALNAPVTNVAAGAAGTNAINLGQDASVVGLTASASHDLAVARTGALGTTTLTETTLSTSGTGGALSLTTTTGTLGYPSGGIVHAGSGDALSVNGGTSAISVGVPVTVTGGRTASVTARSGGSVTVSGNVNASGAVTGVVVSGPTAGNTVSFTGATVLGTSSSRLSGGTAVSVHHNAQAATTSFSNLSIFTSGQTAIDAQNGGTFNVTTGAVDALNGRALSTQGIALGVAVTGVTQTAGPGQAILMTSTTGSFTNSGATSISSPPTQGILVSGSTVTAAFGNTTINGGTDAVSLQNNSSGTRSFGTLTIGSTTSPSAVGFLHAVGGGTTTVSGLTAITSGTGTGIDIQNSTTPVTFAGVTVTKTASGTGVNLVNDSALVTFGSLSITTPGGSGLVSTGSSVSTSGGTITATGGPAVSATTTNFNSSTLASVSSTTSPTQGIALATCSGSLTMSGGTITGAIGIPFSVTGGTVSATYGGGITQALNNPMVSVSGGHGTGTITFQTGTLAATNGTGLQFDNADGTYGFNGTTTLNGGDAGIDILNGSSGTFAFGSATSITNPSGIAFSLNASSPNVTCAGTITQNNAQRAVSATGLTGGTTTFSGAIASTSGTGLGIFLNANTGATVAFTGGMNLVTNANAGFTATGGGTVSATQNNTSIVNTLTTTTATALNVANTTIGAAGLTFRSISSSGGSATGIILDTTGPSGGLTVTGDGSNTSLGGNSSGGTIANKSGVDLSRTTGVGIYLNSTSNVVLRRMTINGTNQNFGIRGFGVNNFTLEYATVGGTSGTNPANNGADDRGEGGIYFGSGCGIGGGCTNGLTGSAALTGVQVSGGAANNVSLLNISGTLDRFVVTGSAFGLNQNLSGSNHSLAVEAFNGGTVVNVTVTGSTFTGSPSYLCNFVGQTATTMDVVFGGVTGVPGTAPGNALSNSHPGNIIGGGGLTLATQGSMTFHVQGNSMRDSDGSAITLQKASAGTLLSGFLDNNTIGVAATPDSGSRSGNGIFASYAGAGTASVTITNNQIHQIKGNAHIYADNTGGSYAANFRIEHNTLDTPGSGWFAGIAVTNGSPTSTDTINVCAKIGGTTAAEKNILNLGGQLGVIVGSSGQNGGHTFNLPTYAGGASLTNVETFIQGNNSGSFTTNAYVDAPATAAAFTGVGTGCGTPVN